MNIQKIKVNEILTEKSFFSLKDHLFALDSDYAYLTNSFKRLGILTTIIVYKDSIDRFHLIDGENRINYAKHNNIDTIDATVLPEITPSTDILTMIFYIKRSIINESAINKVHFIHFAASINAPESWIFETLCIPLGFKPHIEFLKECEHICSLHEELRRFCHDKKFSLKQILNLIFYSEDILMKLISWKSIFKFSASTLEEIASNLNDYMRANNENMEHFINEPEFQEIIHSSLSLHSKTERLRKYIHRKRFPILSEVNSIIRKTVNMLHLPKNINISWDETLENKKVALTIQVEDHERWTRVIEKLNKPDIENAIKNILSEF